MSPGSLPHHESVISARRCGDSGLLLEVEDTDAAHQMAGAVHQAALPAVLDVVPALRTVLVVIDPRASSLLDVAHTLSELRLGEQRGETGLVRIPVHYDGEDLRHVASLTGLTVDKVVELHTESDWRVAFCGFAPGFAYLVGGDPRLQVPRRDESRVRVPAGAVALAGEFASVYPRESPGGWQLIGHTDAKLWDLTEDPPSPLVPGVNVRFLVESIP